MMLTTPPELGSYEILTPPAAAECWTRSLGMRSGSRVADLVRRVGLPQ